MMSDDVQKKSFSKTITLLILLVLIPIIGVIGYFAYSYWAEKSFYDSAIAQNRIDALQKYFSEYPNGYKKDEAMTKFGEIYDNAIKEHNKFVSPQAEAKSISIINDIFKSTKANPLYKVGVAFKRKTDFPDNLEAELRKKYKFRILENFKPALKDSELEEAERSFLVSLKSMFTNLKGDSLLQFEKVTAEENPLITIDYTLKPTDKLLYSYNDDPRMPERNSAYLVFVGDWNFELTSPLNSDKSNFSFSNTPITDIRLEGLVTPEMKGAYYAILSKNIAEFQEKIKSNLKGN